MREAFVWTGSIGFILVLLLSPIFVANSNSKLIIESLENSIENLIACSTLNNVLFELASSLLDYCRLALGKNNGYLDPNLLNLEVNRLVSEVINHQLRFLSVQGYSDSRIHFTTEFFESSANTRFEPVLHGSKHRSVPVYPEGAVGILVYPSVSMSRETARANEGSPFAILCPYRMFLIKRVEEQIYRKATDVVEGQSAVNASLDSHLASINKGFEGIVADYMHMMEKILISLRTSLIIRTIEKSENMTQLDVFFDVEIFDLQPKAYYIESATKIQLGVRRSYFWRVFITHSLPKET